MTELQNPAIPEGIHQPYGSTEHISGRCLQCHKTFSKHSAIGAHCPLELGFSSIFIWTPARIIITDEKTIETCRNAFANSIDFSNEPYVPENAVETINDKALHGNALWYEYRRRPTLNHFLNATMCTPRPDADPEHG